MGESPIHITGELITLSIFKEDTQPLVSSQRLITLSKGKIKILKLVIDLSLYVLPVVIFCSWVVGLLLINLTLIQVFNLILGPPGFGDLAKGLNIFLISIGIWIFSFMLLFLSSKLLLTQQDLRDILETI
jgi:hypothetical protein